MLYYCARPHIAAIRRSPRCGSRTDDEDGPLGRGGSPCAPARRGDGSWRGTAPGGGSPRLGSSRSTRSACWRASSAISPSSTSAPTPSASSSTTTSAGPRFRVSTRSRSAPSARRSTRPGVSSGARSSSRSTPCTASRRSRGRCGSRPSTFSPPRRPAARSNGADLVDAIRARTGLETRVLSGREEATYASLGVISGFFQPKGLDRRHGRRQPRGRGDHRRPGRRAHGQHAARRPAGEGDAGRRRRRRRRSASTPSWTASLPPLLTEPGLLRDRRRLAGAGARPHRDESARRSASCTATTSTPTTCARSPRRSPGWRRRRSRRFPTFRRRRDRHPAGRRRSCSPACSASSSRSGWCSRCSGCGRAGSTPSSTGRSSTAIRCSRARSRSACRRPACRSSAPRSRAGPTTSSRARRRATGASGSRSAP